jgi:hypothetical protein
MLRVIVVVESWGDQVEQVCRVVLGVQVQEAVLSCALTPIQQHCLPESVAADPCYRLAGLAQV